ncbi:sulfotransferase domain-containing protein [Bradyrhizobium sp. BR 10261]|uniref:sulfotransferase domain-containing protein n=1 Tax=Bradyrhizobium sp. BR 10261 TaxID=2749992 RepID=UPI001C64D6CF|nr:sulfotransferase domain-containing protein [Bradyrhizobium sp. BR 10261]MBW7967145.1 sulfotransferase domain-containing protein [Bradyrhizobium sp. BR 10261]
MLSRPAQCVYRTWVADSRHWDKYLPRHGDIIVATYPKCGTTWMQQIVRLLISKSPMPAAIPENSPRIDRRSLSSIESMIASIERQEGRRSLKSHLPLDGLPVYDEVNYIYVARDGRDACMSYHNHCTGFSQAALGMLDAIGLADPTIGAAFPRAPTDPADFFHEWVGRGVSEKQRDGWPYVSFLHFVRTFWSERSRPNILLVHYNDLKANLAGEMRRIADFLHIVIPEALWPSLVDAASFEAMSRDGAVLLSGLTDMFDGGAERFFFRGNNRRWEGVFRDDDLAHYAANVDNMLSRECAHWLAHGCAGIDVKG